MPDCKHLKLGNFQLVDNEGNTFIQRKRFSQIEYSVQEKSKIKLKVKWTDECTYTMSFKKMILNPENITYPKDLLLTARITSIKKKSYIVDVTSNYDTKVQQFEIFIMD